MENYKNKLDLLVPPLVVKYKELLRDKGGLTGLDELYKWELLTRYVGELDEQSPNLIERLEKIHFGNLMYPNSISVIKNCFCKVGKEKYLGILQRLLRDRYDVGMRIRNYVVESKELYAEIGKKGYKHSQDERTTATLLAYCYPQKYTFYKYTTYENLCVGLGLKESDNECYGHYLKVLYDLIPYLKADTGLCEMIGAETKDLIQSDVLMAQDFVWQMYGSVRKQNKDNDIKSDIMNNRYEPYIALLENSKNIVLTGAPGTGKTYLAKQIAAAFTGTDPDDENNSQISFVQFHPSYDYTDFVEGLRAEKTDSGVTFVLKNGIFKEFCKRAIDSPTNKYVFIIDEINRGEISKIFGELFFSIDPGYRGKRGKVKTQYANLHSEETDTIFDADLGAGWFYVPENVYIIATMNDIDRSVENMDFAMRRRFTWKEITVDERIEMLDGKAWKDEAVRRMKSLNVAIEGVDGLGKAFHIGPAYFLKLDNYGEDKWQCLWDYHLLPLVSEYLRGMPEANELIGDLEKAYKLTKEADANNV